MTTMFNEGSKVFVNHPQKSWVTGQITKVAVAPKGGATTYSVQDDEGSVLPKVNPEDVTLFTALEDIDDLLLLTVLHGATLLQCLKIRYMRDVVYTNIGAIVVAFNPFNFKIPRYLDSQMPAYLAEGEVIRNNLPHSWAVAHNTYYELISNKQNQSVLVSGESGAGKTEACKIVMKYFGQVSMLRAGAEEKDAAEVLRQRILQASPILEGFGNAKTVRNDNSSRFGKFMMIQFHPEKGHLMGALTIKYLLEKSRIITAGEGERAYHAYYLLTKGKDAAKYGLKSARQYKLLTAGNCVDIPGVNDAQDYSEVRSAMDTVGISAAEQDALFSVVGGCLVSQNLQFRALDGGERVEVDPTSADSLQHQAKLWNVSAADLQKEYLTTTREVRGEVVVVQHKMPVAIDMRDSLVKHLYDSVFTWLVGKINLTTKSANEAAEDGKWIGLLDIFGFEDFKHNSFEQICINLTNETLQNHYNNYIFTRDMAECKAEGINVSEIVCPDNSLCLKLVADRLGILGILDDECALPSGTDAGFYDKLGTQCATNPFFEKPRIAKEPVFIVKHYAGNVRYNVQGFVEKNRDSLKDALRVIMQASPCEFTKNLLAPHADKPLVSPSHKASSISHKVTVGGFFRSQVVELMDILNSTNPHWIRCIKPHPAKKPLMFDGVSTMKQLESSGVLGTVAIRKAGYPVRMNYPKFSPRYKVLAGKVPRETASLEEHQAFATKVFAAAKIQLGKLAQLGKTKVFMKSEAYHQLEKARDEAGLKHRTCLQAAARALLSQQKRRISKWKVSAIIIQDDIRDYFRKSAVAREERRRAREALLAQQKLDRNAFFNTQDEETSRLFDEQNEGFRALMSQMNRERQWLENKMASDAMVRGDFASEEYKVRLSIWRTDFAVLNSFRPAFIALGLRCVEELEQTMRMGLVLSQARKWDGLLQTLQEMFLNGQRVAIERFERKVRRSWGKIEQLLFDEICERCDTLPQYVRELADRAYPFGKKILADKARRDRLARRGQNLQQVRERAKEEEIFTHRHTSDYQRTYQAKLCMQGGGHDRSFVSSPTYIRQGDTVKADVQWAVQEAWVGVNDVPDIDQVTSGCRKKSPKKKDSTTTYSPPRELPSPSPNKTTTSLRDWKKKQPGEDGSSSSMRTTGVNEKFMDRFDEMQFLTQRQNVAADFKILTSLGRYDGPFVKIAAIPDKVTLRLAQEVLSNIIIEFSKTLVKKLRNLEAFCLQYNIPEQNRVTGEWVHYKVCDPHIMSLYPQCTEWKTLQQETERLTYAVENYKSELLRIIQNCLNAGAKVKIGPVSEEDTIQEVHQAYEIMKGSLLQCKRCMYPMASKDALVANRITWPRVQSAKNPDSCRNCHTSAFSKVTADFTSPGKTSPKKRSPKFSFTLNE